MTTNSANSNANPLPLSEEERALIMGTLLGDGHLQKRKGSYRLKIDHSIDQEALVQWKYKKLKRLCATTQPPRVTIDRKGFKGIEFYTSSGAYLAEIHELFYQPKVLCLKNKAVLGDSSSRVLYVKTITQRLIDNLPMNPIVLATFFMDDGSVRNDCYAGKIATQGFSKEESHLLSQYLDKWGITGSQVVTHTKKSGLFYLSLPARSKTFAKFVEVIEPVVKEIPEMVYKLNYNAKPRND